MNRRRLYLALVHTSVFFLGAGSFMAYVHFNPPASKIVETRAKGNYKFINPLVECDAGDFSEDANLIDLKKNVQFYINNQTNIHKIEFASVYYRNLNNGPWIGINAAELFSPSSLIKIPLMMAYYKMADVDPSILQKTLSYTTAYDYSQQNYTPQITIVPQQKYTIEELIEHMIIYSDNAAYTILNNNLDANTVIQTYNDLGVDISKGLTDPNGNIISVKDYSSFFRILYNASYLSKNMSEKALGLLSQSKFTDGLVAGVPDSVAIAHKFGERQYTDTHQKQLHDCGIVYLPKKPYLICIMTRGNNFSDMANTIKNISTLTYKEISADND